MCKDRGHWTLYNAALSWIRNNMKELSIGDTAWMQHLVPFSENVTWWKCGVTALDRMEELSIGMLHHWKQTSETSCVWEGWRHGCMHPSDLWWWTSPRTWFVSQSLTSASWIWMNEASGIRFPLEWRDMLYSFLFGWSSCFSSGQTIFDFSTALVTTSNNSPYCMDWGQESPASS